MKCEHPMSHSALVSNYAIMVYQFMRDKNVFFKKNIHHPYVVMCEKSVSLFRWKKLADNILAMFYFLCR